MTTTPAPAVPRSAARTDDALVLDGLTKRFGPLTAVDGIDLRVPRGQVLALLGPNGAGKSTTTEMILGLASPDAGSVRVCGCAPADAVQRGLVGAMLQSGSLGEGMSVRSLLSLVSGIAAHPLGQAEVIERSGIGPLLRKRTDRLSGGEAQRVRFALALLPDPDVILLDEPTVGMDVEARRAFWDRMREVAREGRTVVFATHYLEEADAAAERIVLLAHGRIVADGTPREIKGRMGARTLTLSLAPDGGATAEALGALAAVTAVDRLGGSRVRLASEDSDATLAALFAPGGPGGRGAVRDIEVASPSLEDAFVDLTRDRD